MTEPENNPNSCKRIAFNAATRKIGRKLMNLASVRPTDEKFTELGYSRRRGAGWTIHRWHPIKIVPLSLVYALLSWLPIGYLSRGGGDSWNLGPMGNPFWSPGITVVLSVIAFSIALILFNVKRENIWIDLLSILGIIVVMASAYYIYRAYVSHYAPVTDRATALQYGWEELVAGKNPYYRHTQLDNTISPMLGGIILAGPFATLHGDLYWQGLTWLLMTMIFLAVLCGPRAGFISGALLIFSPAMRLEISIQSDGWLNGAALAISGTCVYLLARKSHLSRWWMSAYIAMSLLFALAFSYRFIYAVVALPLIALLWRHFGAKTMMFGAIPAGTLSALLIFTPYFLDPSVYAPFEKASLGTSSTSVPHLPLITAVTCLVITVVGTFLLRTIAGVWGIMGFMSVAFVLLTGWGQHSWYQYLTWAYNGATLVFILFALMLPRIHPTGTASSENFLETLLRRYRQPSTKENIAVQ
ncbi:hypothetical protein [Austwickia chelonae]|nr:hypothetical protein [Austwickia chelonae]